MRRESDDPLTLCARTTPRVTSLERAACRRSGARGEADSFTSYSTTDSTVATQTAREDAEERLGRNLADQIVTQIFASSGGAS